MYNKQELELLSASEELAIAGEALDAAVAIWRRSPTPAQWYEVEAAALAFTAAAGKHADALRACLDRL
jgi:hypothetical protein